MKILNKLFFYEVVQNLYFIVTHQFIILYLINIYIKYIYSYIHYFYIYKIISVVKKLHMITKKDRQQKIKSFLNVGVYVPLKAFLFIIPTMIKYNNSYNKVQHTLLPKKFTHLYYK